MVEWIETDEKEEAVDTLEAVSRFITDTMSDPLAWRWVILSLHIATQGFMVVALSDSAGLTPLRDRDARKWLDAYRKGEVFSKEKLDSFRRLYKKTKSSDIANYLNGNAFVPEKSQDASVRKLCDLRDEFIHFLPKSWLLEVRGLPRICLDVLDF